ncbi:MAG: hypothetical protein K940chlam9_01105 [Chlamydiae bacterium]|nr:hypothetical protein [Chlamydiota bacterium]
MEPLHDVVADSKGRIPLGIRHARERYLITEDKDGRVILEKAVLMPQREVWLHKNAEAKESVLKGLKQAKQKRLKSNVIDLGKTDEK